MKNEKLENAKSKIVEFYDKHEDAIKIGVFCNTTRNHGRCRYLRKESSTHRWTKRIC